MAKPQNAPLRKKHKQPKLSESSYDDHDYGTAWWSARAKDRAHQRAYRLIAETIAERARGLKKKPQRLIDFACGAGFLIKHLSKEMPDLDIVGIDESQQAIDGAHDYHQQSLSAKQRQRVSLQQMPLPNFTHKLKKAEILVFSFPDFRVDGEKKWVKKWKAIYPDDWDECKRLVRKLKKIYPDAEHSTTYELFIKRIANRNILSMCKKGALVFRIEYSACKRSECDECYLEEMAFYECVKPSHKRLKGERRKRITAAKMTESVFFKSKVVQDVFAQTGNQEDKEGGFFISVFRV